MLHMAKQGKVDRLKRLEYGGCPVHGVAMGQEGIRGQLFQTNCPRGDCNIQGTTHKPHGPVTLDPGHHELLS